MATGFDPYHKWLAIPPAEQPPNLYRLLGLDLFESDPDVIDTAADARMTHLRSLQHGRHADLNQELLNKVEVARHCLLKPEKKAAYDAELRAKIACKTAPEALPLRAATTANLQPASLPQSVPREGSAADPFDFLSAMDRPTATQRDLATSKAVLPQAKMRTQSRWLIALAPILGIAVVIGAILIHNSWDADVEPKPNGISTARVQGRQSPSSVHGSASAGEASIVKPQIIAGEDEGPKESSASAGQEAIAPSKSHELTAGIGNTEPNSDAKQNSRADDGPAKSGPAPVALSASAQSDGQFPFGQGVSSSSGSDPKLSVSHPEQSTVGESWAARAKELIRSGSSPKTPRDRAKIVRSALDLLNKADGADRWSSEALELVKLAETAGRQTNDGPLLADWLQAAETRIRRAKTVADGVTGARDTLAKKADDSDANTILGGFLCFQMDKWEEGLPHLAKGNDPSLTKAAESEQKFPSEPLDQFKLANSWWDAANKRSGVKSNPWFEPIRARAAYWYRKCASGVAGSAQGMAQKRIAEQETAKAELAALADGQFPLPIGRPIDVLRLVDTNSGMVVAGNWSRDRQEISVQPGQYTRIVIPVAIKGSYEFEVEFTRTSGNAAVAAMLSLGPHPCMVGLSMWGGQASGLASVDGHWPIDPGYPIAVRPGKLQNGHRYRLFVSARVDSDDHASIDVSLDGRPYLPHWSGDPAKLSLDGNWALPSRSALGFGINGCAVTFHSARLKMLSGSASLDSAPISANR
jgi:hypothetical protein